ncbi:MAG: MFS transporter [Candidatus Thermoplasmatota archaeon]|nr:MFS transporter [Candidatus Thermoplasmatota archaeon]
MKLTKEVSKNNYYSFLWHATFLALAQNFMDINTIIPAMVIDAGGKAVQVGILTAILIGGGKVSQLFFAPFLSNKQYKKGFLLGGINIRFISLAGLALVFVLSSELAGGVIILFIFLLITLFSISGGFANIGYTDILGKSILRKKRKHFFSMKEIVASIGLLISAYFVRHLLKIYGYPENYTILFFIAAGLLAIASFGFWRIKEVGAEHIKISHLRDYLQTTKKEFKSNKRLKHYLLLINTQGAILALMPFLILYAKSTFGAENEAIGNYLVLKVVGGVIAGAVMIYFIKKIKYRHSLYMVSLLSILILTSILVFPGAILFPYIFLFGGLIYTFHRIAVGGVLLEVTTDKNRALYTGLTGAGNILPALFPLAGGLIIQQFGFNTFFPIFIFILILSLYYIYKLDCKE